MNNQAFHIGDVVKHKTNRFYQKMRIVEIFNDRCVLCEWYNKNWNKWGQTPFNSSELVKK